MGNLNRIPEEKIERIRSSVDIVDVISEYVQLKKQGRNFSGLCPFHGEKTPSFSVSPDKQLYHCFGCGAGGNVFSFFMEIEGLTFIDAIKQLAPKANVEIPEVVNYDQAHTGANTVMVEGHELASKFYHHVLLHTEQGNKALEYLRDRGFTDEMIKKFKLGYAPDSWDTVTNLFKRRNIDAEKMGQSGLLSKREFDGKYFDRFRDRIMFPISDNQGKTIAFGGRIVGEGQPKYLNSPETKIFYKGKTIYGLAIARPTIRKVNQAVLFEGYVDVIAAWQAGVTNGVATLGTAITEEQAKTIRRNAETVIVCYDSDQAGIQASFRASSVLDAVGCSVRVAVMPEGLDPDDFIQKHGAERFKKDVIGASLTLMAFKMRFLRRGKNLQDEGERMTYIEEVLEELSKLPKAVERDHYLRQLADEFSLSLDALKQEQFKMYKAARKNSGVKQASHQVVRRDLQQKKLLPAFHNAERILLAHMMRDFDVAQQVQERIGGSFNVDEYHAIAAHLYAFYAEDQSSDLSQFIQRLDDDKLIKVASELAMMNISDELSEQELSDYIRQIKNYPKWIKIEQKEKEKREAEQQQDVVLAAKIAMEIIEMKKALKQGL